MTIQAYAAKQAKAKLEQTSLDLGELRPNEVDVRVTHCGICHTDVAWSTTNGASHNIQSFQDMRS